MTTSVEREIFRAEAEEGHYLRLIICGQMDELLLSSLQEFIDWRRHVRNLKAEPNRATDGLRTMELQA